MPLEISALAVEGMRRLDAARASMYLLKKVIQLREKTSPEHEKPFLEHLEDLRIMVTRIVLTLLISVIACFAFQKQMMDLLRRPVDEVWKKQLEQKLPGDEEKPPRPLGVDRWEEAKRLEHGASGLDAEGRERLYASHPDQDLVFHARCVGMLRAAMVLPADAREGFLTGLPVSEEMRAQVKALLVKEPSAEMDSRGNLRLMSALKPTETFMLSMKISFFSGVVVAFPLLLLFILQFVLPGLHDHEKKVLWPALAIGFGLFLAGVCFAYFVVLPRALMFFYEWSGSLGVSNDWRIGEYISFATQFTLLFGVAFELPVLVMVLVKLGLLTYETMSNTRAYAVLAIVVIAAVLTPTPDALTLVLMAAPMIVLYEICIWLAWLDRKQNRRKEEEEAREEEERRMLGVAAGGAGAASVGSVSDPEEASVNEDGGSQNDWGYGDYSAWGVDAPEIDVESGAEQGDEGDHGALEQQDFDRIPDIPDEAVDSPDDGGDAKQDQRHE